MTEKTVITPGKEPVERIGGGVSEDLADAGVHPPALAVDDDYEGKPTEDELNTLRRVPGKLPVIAYLVCIAEFCERASFYGVQPLISNYVNRPMPKGGNGYGAPPKGTQETAGALGLGTEKANAVSQSFSMLVYALPLVFGWLSDARTGRFALICYGVGVFGLAHVLMMASTAPNLLANGKAEIPYFLSLYILAVGAAMFKPCVSPLLLDQMRDAVPKVEELPSGERVIVDPEATTERAMLWFYLMINIGGFMGVATSYSEKYVGWWLAYLIPLLLYIPLPFLLWWLRRRLVLYPPEGSDLPNVCRLLSVIFRRGGLRRLGRHGFWELGKPSVVAAVGETPPSRWNDEFVEDVRKTFQATGIFCFFPIQYINDNGLGSAANYLSTELKTNGVPNDVISNFNSLCIIGFTPVLNYGLYPLLRRYRLHYGVAARITTGLAMAAVGGAGYAILNYYGYRYSPCGKYASSDCSIGSGVADVTIWWMAIPYGLGGISELFVNVPAYGLAYAKAPPNMRGLLSAINLLSTAVAYAIGLACSAVIVDPYLTWDFGGPAIVGAVLSVVFYMMFRHLDGEAYELSRNDEKRLGGSDFQPPMPVEDVEAKQ